MPEGDSIYKVAQHLRAGLEGRRIELAELHGRPVPSLRRQVVSVEPLGKHLLIGLEGGETIRVHLGMHGSWHRYRSGEAWRRPRRQASLRLDAFGRTFVCFNAMMVDFLDARQVRLLRRQLHFDLLDDEQPFDAAAVVDRARRLHRPEQPILDVLLDQRTAAGIGNVYKSEVLFEQRIHPLLALGSLSDEQVSALFSRAREQLRANVAGVGRRTTGRSRGPRHFVYGRGGQPCLDCASEIRSARLGRGRRSTYWCPKCQPEEATAASAAETAGTA